MMGEGKNKYRLGARVTASLLASLTVGCKDTKTDETEDDACVSDLEFFSESVYAPILATDCANCHNDAGDAKDTSFILRTQAWGPNYIEQNLEMFTQLAKLEYEGTPWIILKPTLGIEHAGGQRFAADSDKYRVFQEMVARLDDPTECADDGSDTEFFDGVELLDEVATLRKATLSLVGRLPTLSEEQRVRDGSFAALDVVLDEVMREEQFFVRLKEIYNDHFLTDRYYVNDLAIGLLDEEDYPNRDWFETYPEDQIGELRSFTSRAIAREPLELVAHIVRNDFAYTEIVTANYTMVNWYSAQTYGVPFDGEQSYDEFKPAQVGIPHSGVLSTPVWLNRFPTTDTNRNRHRSRMLYEFFLATDVQALGNRPVDAAAITGVNPTRNDPNCTICHDVVDPVAGAFQNWDSMGRYRPPEMGWYPEMAEAGFGDSIMPAENSQAALQWLADRIKNDRRFALSAVHIMFKGLSGQEPLQDPDDPQAAGYLEEITAAKQQRLVFDQVVEAFIASGYKLKTVVKEIVKSPYYRAHNTSVDLDESRAAELAELGTGRLLTPEQLNRKIVATTGYPFRNNVGDTDYLLDTNWYRILYGGIDSDTVINRITETNGVMANVAMRMANEMSCRAVAADFAKDPSDRVMFPLVDVEYQPEDDNGFEVPAAAAAIRANIQFLTQRLWGEYLDINDPEINAAFALFISVWEDGKRGLEIPEDEGGYGNGLPGPCRATSDYYTGEPLPEERRVESDPNYTIRAWMAVITYMLSDYRFLHE